MPKLPPDRLVLDRKSERQKAQAARLQRVRRALGISQKYAAETVGVPYLKWHKMEHGTHPLDPLALQIFCEKYELGADYVILAMYTALPPVLREQVLQMEQEELRQAREGISPATQSADTRDKQGLQVQPPAQPPSSPDLHGRRKRKSSGSLLAVLA
jgi:transcriptional regulator with XRE-family HTH domain